MKLHEMEGFLRGKCFPGDMRVNETTAQYLCRIIDGLKVEAAHRQAGWNEAHELSVKLEAAEKRIVELSEGKVGAALLERETHHVEVVGALQSRIAELESHMALAAMDSKPVATSHDALRIQGIDFALELLTAKPAEPDYAQGIQLSIGCMNAAKSLIANKNVVAFNDDAQKPAPVAPDELLKEYLRLVACMLSDYRNGNYGDAQRWIRHIAKASDVFAEKHGLSPWEMAKNII